ncbi:Peptide chain release factor 1 [Candidatus Annandia adelgestsuga]|uniref:Peptide chain release factor 1 n=1 Tax=Candidatus Annandia adelgestsuga TaxID=1302411 RepID=A0A3Q9CLL7_9ENTR|nr:peptide chain release factor 1 [Candidatus Annandia adelgestsuga]AZP36369.1 Peptide chain release factor 1 [Candidatus Annandia adelgestsuga]
MKNFIINKLEYLKKRNIKIEKLFFKKLLIKNKNKFKTVSNEYYYLNNINILFEKWKKKKKKIKKIFLSLNKNKNKNKIKIINKYIKNIKNKIYELLLPKNYKDKLNCFVEIRSGTGGNEASIFAGNLFKMYNNYAGFKKWNVEIININNGDHGGFKEILIKIIGKWVYKNLKFESGGHRVQRVPETETQGRIHTSTCIIAVIPITPEVNKIKINNKDLKIDTFRASGAGGQHVNTTDSAIRITHLPTGIISECQDERSQHKNKSKALSILYFRIYAAKNEEINKKKNLIRKNLLGSGSRSDRNRTYNFSQDRVTDHRINLTIYRLHDIIEGKLDLLIKPLIEKYKNNKLKKIFKI